MIDFGLPHPNGALVRLRWDMSTVLLATAARLPPELRTDAWHTLRNYTDGTDDFFRLFYLPVWSFLHWAAPVDAARREAAVTAQALALFLHLWDDHLCDGQLPLNPARLHLRTLAWQRFETAARALDPARYESGSRAYFATTQPGFKAGNLNEYLGHAERQMAIWYIVPGALGGDDLGRVIARFSRAWRLVDDAQDAAEDARTGSPNASTLETGLVACAARELQEGIAIAATTFPPIARELEISLAGLLASAGRGEQ